MNFFEQRAALALASIMSTRMLGLFMILPVFALYAETLPDATPILIGTAIGIYGLTQALLQIPMGMLSDRFGRKPIITIGLLLFAVGSVIAALSTSLLGIIIGRAIQGSGAIAAAVLALAADLTREEQRTKAMAIIGMSIGLSFTLALVLGPVLNQWVGISGIFWFTAVLAIAALVLLHVVIPSPLTQNYSAAISSALPLSTQLRRVLTNTQLLRLNLGVLLLHTLLTGMFVVLPLLLVKQVPSNQHWQIYLPVLLLAFGIALPLIVVAEKHRLLKLMLIAAIILLGFSQLGFSYWQQSLPGIVLMLLVFFSAFTLLEASLPSLVSKLAPAESKGAAMGIYSTAQFFGAFLGGMGGGWLHHHFSSESIFLVGAVLTVLWLLVAVTMQSPRYLSSELLTLGKINLQQANQLTSCLNKVPGVADVVVIIEEGIAYLKVDRKHLDVTALRKCPMMNALLKF